MPQPSSGALRRAGGRAVESHPVVFCSLQFSLLASDVCGVRASQQTLRVHASECSVAVRGVSASCCPPQQKNASDPLTCIAFWPTLLGFGSGFLLIPCLGVFIIGLHSSRECNMCPMSASMFVARLA